jgi:uncharacterized membrane protein
MSALREQEKRFVQGVGFLSGLTIVAYAYRVAISQSFRFGFVFENLALAWLGLMFGWLLVNGLKKRHWLSWQNIVLTILWLAFLPNTWYVLTDFLHISPTGEVSQLYDIVLMSLLVINGFILGFTSLFIVHKELLKRLSETISSVLVIIVIFISSFGIYLGRDLRWNSWDVITNPGGLVLNVSDRVIDPFGHPRAINITGLFFILLCSVYFALWLFLQPVNTRGKHD